MFCEIHMRDFKPHFQQDFLAYCTRPVSVHLAMACVSQLLIQQFFSLFAQFKTTKSYENYVSVSIFQYGHIPPKIMKKHVFYTGKLYGLTGMEKVQKSAYLLGQKHKFSG